MWLLKVKRGAYRQWSFPATSGTGAGSGTPKLAQIFAYGKWLYPYRILLHGASDLDQTCLKMRSSEDECTIPPNIFATTPKITPKPHFVGPFNAKPITQLALRKSCSYEGETLQLYIGKLLGVCQNFSARGVRGAQGPLM